MLWLGLSIPFRITGPLEDVIEDPLDGVVEAPSENPRVIDVRRMHVHDCFLDVKRHGLCELRLSDHEEQPIVRRYRFELLEEILESAESVD